MKKGVFILMMVLCCSTSFGIMAFNQNDQDLAVSQKRQQRKLTFKIISSESDTWGYDIISNGKKLIHQPNKPGVAGNKGFQTKKMAELVALKIIEKIKKGEMPPSISPEELEKLGVY